MIKAIKVLILSLALALGGGGMWVTAHTVGAPPPVTARIGVNLCNGAITGYKAPFVYGVTATHCIKAPMDIVRIAHGVIWLRGEAMTTHGDITYIRWQAPKPEHILPIAFALPKPGEGVWVVTVINGDYLPIPGIWLGTPMDLGDIKAFALYGSVSKGFSGSPVLNTKGEIFGIISVGTFIDGQGSSSIIAPWAGVTILPHLEKK